MCGVHDTMYDQGWVECQIHAHVCVCLMGPCGKTRLMTNVRVPFPRSMGPMMLLIVMLDMKLLCSVVLGRTSARPYLNSCPSVGLTYGVQA